MFVKSDARILRKISCLEILLIVLILIMIPVKANAENSKKMQVGDDVIATISNGVVTLSGNGPTWDYSYVPGCMEPVFKDLEITDVVVSKGITELGSSLFDQCEKLKTVRLPEGLKIIGDACFARCPRLTEINIPEGVEEIGWFAFQGCRSLTKMSLPESITVIGSSVFAQCKNLVSLNIPLKVTRIESNLIDGCIKLKNINIPDGVTFIDFSAFASSGITAINLPQGITSIKECTFWECTNLRKIKIPGNVRAIGESAFWGTFDLTVFLPDSVEEIADDAFEAAFHPQICAKAGSYAEVYAKKHGITFIAMGADTVKKYDDRETGNSYTVISGKKEVEYTSTTSREKTITIPSVVKIMGTTYKVKAIADGAFQYNRAITSIYIGKSINKIGRNAFRGCTQLRTVSGGWNVTSIGSGAFDGDKKLSEMDFGPKLTSIGERAFYNCTALKTVTIPARVTVIGRGAFQGCKRLKTITIKAEKLKAGKVGKNAFKGIAPKAIVMVPKKAIRKYKSWLVKKGVPAKAEIVY